MTYNRDTHELVTDSGQRHELPVRRGDVLSALKFGRTVPYGRILKMAWGDEYRYPYDGRLLTTEMSRLRRMYGLRIRAHHGIGYVLEDDVKFVGGAT